MGKLVDLTGERFDYLLVIERAGSDKNKKATWLCKCDCGNEVVVRGNDLRQGKVHSCGCYKTNLLSRDLVGQKFGKLTVIKREEKNIHNYHMWLCKCDCGGKILVTTNHLTTGNTQSCGCLVSKGEDSIIKFLNNHNISYIKQYYFKDLLGKKDAPLRFDIAIFQDEKLIVLVEFQGIQHYENVYNLSEKDWEYTLKRDKMKKEYCKNNNIPLEEILYSDDIEERLKEILEKWKLNF